MTDTHKDLMEELRHREELENAKAISAARKRRKPVTFTAEDGCKVTAFPSGHAFYNAEDWW